MTDFLWILASGVVMNLVALVGAVTLLLTPTTFARLVLPLVAFAAGSLLGGALFHMIPAALDGMPVAEVFLWVAFGFSSFFALEQFLHWHHCHRAAAECRKPLTYLILIGDGLHNFIGGLSVAGAFLIDTRVGIATMFAALAHEVPQELGDFGVLVHGGWPKSRALVFNVLSASTFLVGGLIAFVASFSIDVMFMVPFAAGNFIYIAASDLVPEVNKHPKAGANAIDFVAFVGGLGLLYGVRLVFAA